MELVKVMNFKTGVWLSSQTWIEKYKRIYIKEKQWDNRVGGNLELHKHWTRLKIALN